MWIFEVHPLMQDAYLVLTDRFFWKPEKQQLVDMIDYSHPTYRSEISALSMHTLPTFVASFQRQFCQELLLYKI